MGHTAISTGSSAPNPTEWFHRFRERYDESISDPSSELGIFYGRHRPPPTVEVSPGSALDEYTNTEWSNVMAVFFSRLAREFGLYQAWEWNGRADLAWFLPGTSWEIQTLVVQEDEANESILDREVPVLIDSGAGLGVLVMYPDCPAPQGTRDLAGATQVWAERIGGRLAERDLRSNFLLVTIGSNSWDVPAPWKAFQWDPTTHSMRPVE